MSDSRKCLIAVVIAALSALCVVLITPLFIDNYILQSVASDLYRFGKIPYIGSWDHSFPCIFGIHYITILLFGTKEIGFRIFDVVVQFCFAIMFYKLLLRWLRPKAAALAAIIYIFYYVGHGASLYGQRDVYLMMLIIASLFLLLTGKSWTLLAGLLAGLAVLMKPTALFDLGLLALYVIFNSKLRPAEGAVSHVAIFILAGIFPLAAVLIYYSFIPGGLEAFYLSAFRFNLDIYTKFHTPFHDFVAELWHYGLLLALAGYSILGQSFSRARLWNDPFKKDKLFLLLLVASNIFVVIVQRKYIPYHFAPFFMSVIPLAAMGIERLASRIGHSSVRYFVVILCIAGSVFVRFPWQAPEIFVKAFFQNQGAQPSFSYALNATYDSAYNSPDWGAKPEKEVINYLGRPENKDGSVEIFSFVPLLRMHLDRVFAGPYVMPTAIACRDDGGVGAVPHYTDYQIRWRAAYMDTLLSVSPRFLIIDRKTQYWYLHDIYESWLRYMPGFDSLLNSSYRYDTSFGGYQIFRRRSG